MTPEELSDRVDALVDTDVLKLRDALFAVIGKLDALDGRSAETDEMLDEIRATLEEAVSL